MSTISLPCAWGGRLPIRRIYCVGQNYSLHVREMGGDPTHSEPCFFMKPTDGLLDPTAAIPYPPATRDFHHEVELVVVLGQGGKDLSVEEAHQAITAYGVGLDLTRRDLQAELKRRGHPWELAKSFTGSAIVSSLYRWENGLPPETRLSLEVNGTLRQEATLADMLLPVPELLARLSRYDTLAPGDLLFTGTPAGVAPLVPGDRLTARCAEAQLETSVIAGR